MWWSAEPSILKGWIDRILTPGFAYEYKGTKTKKLLKGKTGSIFITSHAPTFFYKLYGGVVSRCKHMILGFCGIKLKNYQVMGRMESKIDTEERRSNFISKCSDTLKK